MAFFRTRYRVARDRWYPSFWAVQYRYWWWPAWIEEGNGLLPSKEAAVDMIATLQDER